MTRIAPFSVAADWQGLTLPLFACPVPIGFAPAPDDYPEAALNLHDLLFARLPTKFLALVSGDSMAGVGIFPGDVVAVDPAVEVVEGCIVAAVVGDEYTLRRLRRDGNRPRLKAQAEPRLAPPVLGEAALNVLGVVTHVIPNFQKRWRR